MNRSMVDGTRLFGCSQTDRISEAGVNIVKFGHQLQYGCRVVSIGSYSALDIIGLQVSPQGLMPLVLTKHAVSTLFSSSSCGLRRFVGLDRFRILSDRVLIGLSARWTIENQENV